MNARKTHARRIIALAVVLAAVGVLIGIGWWMWLTGIAVGFVFAYAIVRPSPRHVIVRPDTPVMRFVEIQIPSQPGPPESPAESEPVIRVDPQKMNRAYWARREQIEYRPGE